jgi:hypothetical protein
MKIIQGAIAEAAQAIMQRLLRNAGLLHQGHESFLQNILCLAVGEPQRTAIENDLRGPFFIQALAPMFWFVRH